ncbi:MAG: DUF4142 domain-containing protein [Acidobacteria bacterium]|nr:DUF4142 domain-containing protein [Acidobacteriota bacterium]
MKKMFYLTAMFVLAMCASVVPAQTSGSMNSSGDKMSMSGKANADAKFMMMAATSDMNEIGLSNMALQKSTNDDVKKMAQMMVDDHTKASDELKPIAASKNVVLPASMDAKHQAMMTKMQAMSGEAFDRAYIKAMVKDHQKAVKMFTKESTGGKDADARAFATKTLPVLQSHLTMAQSMNGKMMNMKMDGSMKSGM